MRPVSGLEDKGRTRPASRPWLVSGRWLRDALRRPRVRRLALGSFLVALAVLLALVRPWDNFARVVSALRGLGVFGPVVYVALVSLAFVLPPAPDLVLVAGGGIAFGTVPGAALSLLGALLGAAVNFCLARRFGRPWLARVLGAERMRHVDAFSARMGWGLLLGSRLLPGFNFSLMSLAAGLTGLPLGTFLGVTALGSLPLVLAVSATGDALPGRPGLFLLGVGGLGIATLVTGLVLKRRSSRD